MKKQKVEKTKARTTKAKPATAKKPSPRRKASASGPEALSVEGSREPSTEAAADETRTPAQVCPDVALVLQAGREPDSEAPSPAPEPRSTKLPPVGTTLRKLDRQGQLRCECEIVAGGVQYKSTVYRSLSAAALAAAKDLGLSADAVNGFTFWGLTKVTRSPADPLSAVERAWDRYQERLESILGMAPSETAQSAVSALERHVRVLRNLHAEAQGS